MNIFGKPQQQMNEETAKNIAMGLAYVGDLQGLVKHLKSHSFNHQEGDEAGMTMLHHAVISGNLEVVMKLVEDYGLDVNAEDISGHTPLFNTHTEEIANYLDSKGADLEHRDYNGLLATAFSDVVDHLYQKKDLSKATSKVILSPNKPTPSL